MLLQSLAILPTLSVVVLATAQSVGNPVSAIWDGKCFYPVPDTTFDPSTFGGTWYRVAGNAASYITTGCKCITANYTVNPDGTVTVENSCEQNGHLRSAKGLASPAPSTYGRSGVFKVEFPSGHHAPLAAKCPGPNYVVLDYTPDIAVVGGANFTNTGILSRRRDLDKATVDAWIKRTAFLGADLSKIERDDQTGCKFNN